MTGLRLDGQVAVVTGAASGIGRASAQRLAAEGARVVVVDIDGDGAQKVADDLPHGAIAVRADVAAEDQVDAYAAAAVAAFGRIDLHHLNAGCSAASRRCPTCRQRNSTRSWQ